MRKFLLAALLLPLPALAGTLNLEFGYYWQVQNSATYATVCEGHIAVCETADGLYNIINLDTGEREENVIVSSQPPPLRPIVKTEICKIDYTFLAEASYDGFPTARCGVTCPEGMIAIGAEASGEYSDDRADPDTDFTSNGIGFNFVAMLMNVPLDESTFTPDSEDAYRIYATAVCL